MPAVRRLPGMRDEGPQELARREAVQGSLRDMLASNGYQFIETPLLEPTELFLRKSGGELASRMYTFTDPGGNGVSLRPELTSSTIRYYLERGDAERLPVRLQYGGPVFRYDEGTGYRQFHQLGAELIGSPDPEADAEVLALACEGLSLLGVPSPQAIVGHVGVLHRMLEALGLSQRAQVFLVANLPRIKQGPQEAQEVLEHAQALGLTTPGDTTRGSYLLVEDMEEEEALAVLQDLFHDSFSGPMGNRSTEEILSRFIQKLRRGDDPERVDRGISILSRMASLKGEARPILSQVRSVVGEYGLDPKVLGPLEEVVSGFQKRKTEVSLTLDMGLVRDIAYYTGMVFEVLASGPDGGTLALCGGGRYDGLVKALGGTEDVPALGFAYTVETLLELMPERLEGGHLTSSYSQRR